MSEQQILLGLSRSCYVHQSRSFVCIMISFRISVFICQKTVKRRSFWPGYMYKYLISRSYSKNLQIFTISERRNMYSYQNGVKFNVVDLYPRLGQPLIIGKADQTLRGSWQKISLCNRISIAREEKR